MSAATPLPRQGDVFFDSRGAERALRLSRHPDAEVVVLSIWNGGVCQGTFRLPADQIAALAEALLSAAPETRPPLPQTGQYEPPPAGTYDAPPVERHEAQPAGGFEADQTGWHEPRPTEPQPPGRYEPQSPEGCERQSAGPSQPPPTIP
ncbi:MAG: hypothetical protein ACJ72W_29560 [Actinoallomurus sp.]